MAYHRSLIFLPISVYGRAQVSLLGQKTGYFNGESKVSEIMNI